MDVLNQDGNYNRTSKYQSIKTQPVLDILTARGFEITDTAITEPRIADKEGYQKHMVRLTHPGLTLRGVDDSRPEIVIVNSADGTTSLQFLVGIFRMVCANGMIVGQTVGDANSRIRHVGNVTPKVNEAIDRIIESFPKVAQHINAMQNTPEFNLDKMLDGARLVLPKDAIFSPDSVIRVRRYNDNGTNLWSVYNRIQESVLRGGIKYKSFKLGTIDTPPHWVNGTTRAVKSIDRKVKLNKALWDLAVSQAA